MDFAPERPLANLSLSEDEDALSDCFESFIELSNDLFLITDDAANVVYVNEAFRKVTQLSLEEVKGRKAHSLIKVPEDMEMVKGVLDRLTHGKAWEGSLTLARKEQEPVEIRTTIIPRVNKLNAVTHYLCSGSQVSVAMRNDEDAKNLESLSHLANGVAHRFNNLLASVMGQTELIGMLSNENPAIMQRIDKILKASGQGKEMIAQLMKFCKKQEQHTRRLDLLPIMKNAIKIAQRESPKTIQWDIDLPRSTFPLMGIASDLHEVVMHLLKNAVEAMDEMGGTVSIRLSIDDKSLPIDGEWSEEGGPQQCLKLSVSDTGVGIPETNLRYIFEPFYTTHNMATAVGMGLSIVHGVVKSHGGIVNCESAVGKGSTFNVYLPALAIEAESESDLLGPKGGGEYILLVDDEPLVTEAGASQLGELGYEVEVANSVHAALGKVRENQRKFNLIITDYRMPDGTGISLAEELKAEDIFTPVMLTHALNERMLIRQNERDLFAGMLLKPCPTRDFAEAIQEILNA